MTIIALFFPYVVGGRKPQIKFERNFSIKRPAFSFGSLISLRKISRVFNHHHESLSLSYSRASFRRMLSSAVAPGVLKRCLKKRLKELEPLQLALCLSA